MNNDPFELLSTLEGAMSFYKLARFTYRMGEPLIDDATYASLEELLEDNSEAQVYFNRSYDDDPIPVDLVERYGYSYLLPNFDSYGSKYDDYIDSEKSMSIRAIGSYKEAYDYCRATRGLDKTLSVKINGVNIKGMITKEDGEDLVTPKVFRTRGRNGESFNVTKNLVRVFNNSSDIAIDKAMITGECYVSLDGMDNLVSPRGTVMRVSRSAAMSMLRTDFKDDDYKYLRYKIFNCDGLGNSNYENLQKLKEKGYDIAPTIFIPSSEIPEEFAEFCAWLKSKMDYFYDVCQKEFIPADGLVMDVDNRDFTGEVNGQYSDKNIALKFEYWSHKYYVGVVREIMIEQRSKKCSIRASIEPLITEDNTEAKTVNLHSLAIMIKEGIKPGSKIYFKRDSEVYNNLVYGDELYSLLGVDNTCQIKETKVF